MPDADSDDILERLTRVNRCLPGKALPISAEEHARLLRYTTERLEVPTLSDRERSFYTQIVAQLNGNPPRATAAQKSRANFVLRAGIDKCEAALFSEVTTHELSLMEHSIAQLDALADPTSAHLRLKDKIQAAVDAYYAHTDPKGPSRDRHARYEDTIEPPSAGLSRSPDELFAKILLEDVYDIAGYPVDLRLKNAEHMGNLTLQGDLPEDSLLTVRGSLTVKGAVYGHVHATGTIWVDGNAAQGYLVSDTGDIFCGRASGGASLIAPVGSIRLESAEQCARVYAGKQLRIDGNVRGGTVWAGAMNLGGTLAARHTHCLSEAFAYALDGDGTEAQHFQFRTIVAVGETGRTTVEDGASTLKEHIRLRMRWVISEAMFAHSTADQHALWRLMLYAAKSGPSASPSSAELRNTQARLLYFSVLAAAADSFSHSLIIAMEAGGPLTQELCMAAEGETLQAIAFIEHESARLAPELAADARDAIQTACRQLSGNAHKVKDAAVNQYPLEPVAADLRALVREWRTLADKARDVLARHQPAVNAVLGKAVAGSTVEPAKLEAMAARVAAEVFDPRTTKTIRALHLASDYYARVLPDWQAGVAQSTEMAKTSGEQVADAGIFQLSTGIASKRFVQAGSFARGTRIGTSPTATVQLVLDKAIETATRFGCGHDGIEVRPVA